MAKIKIQKNRKVQTAKKSENEKVVVPSTRNSDDPIPNKVSFLLKLKMLNNNEFLMSISIKFLFTAKLDK